MFCAYFALRILIIYFPFCSTFSIHIFVNFQIYYQHFCLCWLRVLLLITDFTDSCSWLHSQYKFYISFKALPVPHIKTHIYINSIFHHKSKSILDTFPFMPTHLTLSLGCKRLKSACTNCLNSNYHTMALVLVYGIYIAQNMILIYGCWVPDFRATKKCT